MRIGFLLLLSSFPDYQYQKRPLMLNSEARMSRHVIVDAR
jgi:hypothetical protein